VQGMMLLFMFMGYKVDVKLIIAIELKANANKLGNSIQIRQVSQSLYLTWIIIDCAAEAKGKRTFQARVGISPLQTVNNNNKGRRRNRLDRTQLKLFPGDNHLEIRRLLRDIERHFTTGSDEIWNDVH
jgi:hypothetical protein